MIIILIIIGNCIFILLDYSNNEIELFFLISYSIEMILKILGNGFIINKTSYLRNNWNKLDFLIVLSSYFTFFLDSSINFGGFRAIRILRPLRTISSIRNLRVVLVTLFKALPLLTDTLVILIFFFIVYAIAGQNLFSGQLKKRCIFAELGVFETSDEICGERICPDNFICGKLLQNPNWGYTNFDNFMYAFLQIFQCITLEGWSETSDFIAKSFSQFGVIYFISAVLLGSYFILGITLAVIKAQFSETHQKSIEKEKNKRFKKKKIKEKFQIPLRDFRKNYKTTKKFSTAATVFKPDENKYKTNFKTIQQEISYEEEILTERNIINFPYILEVDFNLGGDKNNLLNSPTRLKGIHLNEKAEKSNLKKPKEFNMNEKNEVILKWPENDSLIFEESDNIEDTKKKNKKMKESTNLLMNNEEQNSSSCYRFKQKNTEENFYREKKKEINEKLRFQEMKEKKKKKKIDLKKRILEKKPYDFIVLNVNHEENHRSESSNDVLPLM